MSDACPCCSEKSYQYCCKPAHMGTKQPETCEALMRSRYCAYALRLSDYLVHTTHPSARSKGLKQEIESSLAKIQWLRLSVIKTQQGEAKDKMGKVEFRAEYIENGQPGVLHELSRFVRYQGRWVYKDGVLFG